MKKILAMALALAMSCSMLVSCGKEDDSSSKKDNDTSSVVADDSSKADADDSSKADADDSSKADTDGSSDEADASSADDASSGNEGSGAESIDDTQFAKLVAKINETGACTLSVSYQGLMDMYITTDGESSYADMTVFGIRGVALVTPDAAYTIDVDGKRYYMSDPDEADNEGAELIDEFTGLDGYTYVSTTTESINGKDYTVEKFKDDTDAEMSIAFDADGNVCYMGEEDEYIPFVFTAEADASKLKLDESYTEMTEEEYQEWQASLLGGFLGGEE